MELSPPRVGSRAEAFARPLRYDRLTILLHWLTALLVASLWASEQLVDQVPSGVRPAILSLHISMGVLLAMVLACRFTWRLTKGRSLPDADHGILQLAARGTHYLLYFGVTAAVAAGLALEWIRSDLVWGVIQIPSIAPGDRALRGAFKGYHALAANLTVILAGLHAAAALFHHYVLRDGVVRRMLLQPR